MNKEDYLTTKKKILLWFVGSFLLPPISWLLSAWYFDIWSTEEMYRVLLRLHIPIYVILFSGIVYYIVKRKLDIISDYYENPNETRLLKAQKSAGFIPRFFLIALPVYTTLGNFPVSLPLDFVDNTEFLMGILLGVPIVFLFAIPFFIVMNKHTEAFTKAVPFSDKYMPLSLSQKMTVIFLLSIIGTSVMFISAVISITHNNPGDELMPVFTEKLIVASAVIFGLTLINLSLFKKEILSPLHRIKSNITEIAQGKADLTKRIEINSRDEIGELSYWFNAFLDSMNALIVEIKETVDFLNESGSGFSKVAGEIAKGANKQAETTQEVAALMRDLLKHLEENNKITEKSKKVSSETVKAISENQEIFLNALESVKEISKKSLVISDIAFQSNILSLNASIEAGKAKETGKGFSVVAQEIGNLAFKSKASSDEIIKLSQNGSRKSEQAGKSLMELLPKIKENSELLNLVTQAADSQHEGIESVNKSVNQLSDISSVNSSNSEELFNSAIKLKRSARQLGKIIANFKTKS